jgi:hypothetical protein
MRSWSLGAMLMAAVAAGGCGPSTGAGRYYPAGGGGGDDDGGGGNVDDGGGGGGGGDMAFVDPSTLDKDGDGVTPAKGDCNDNDATVFPGAPELCDMKDHNCNGIVDDICDDDTDGWNVCGPGSADPACNGVLPTNGKPGGDCNDHDPMINPGAFDYLGDNVDNDCNGMVDDAVPACDANLNPAVDTDYAKAIDICGTWLQGAKFVKVIGNNANLSDPRARGIRTIYGQNYKPKNGKSLIMLSTGLAKDKSDGGFVVVQPGTKIIPLDGKAPNPDPMMNAGRCGMALPDEQNVHDYTELLLTIKVPTNANAFSFQFMFDSAEYPEFVGTEFNDKFLVELTSKAFTGNVSFDAMKNPITVNAGFFGVCDSAPICSGQKQNVCPSPVTQLNGTGMEDFDFGDRIGGGTGWLTTTSPVKPGETITLRFIIFDEGDQIYDSSVIIDNFQWVAMPAMGGGGPITHG